MCDRRGSLNFSAIDLVVVALVVVTVVSTVEVNKHDATCVLPHWPCSVRRSPFHDGRSVKGLMGEKPSTYGKTR